MEAEIQRAIGRIEGQQQEHQASFNAHVEDFRSFQTEVRSFQQHHLNNDHSHKPNGRKIKYKAAEWSGLAGLIVGIMKLLELL